jgi:hypothetical protein|tara:strand:+ start:38 stop:691 length:654 start_codon:yes stop_codon:yes gene_type:complete
MYNSFIPTAIAKIAEQKGVRGDIAKVVECAQHDNALNRIALTYNQFSNQRRRAIMAEKETGVRGDDPIAKPEQLLSFIQEVMNQVCWQARRLHNANLQEDLANGIDFSQDVAEQVGVYDVNTEIHTYVNDDFIALNNLQSWLAGKMNYLTDIEPLYYFSQSEQDPASGGWISKYNAMSYDEALCAMTTIIEELEEKNEKQEAQEASDIDFTTMEKVA